MTIPANAIAKLAALGLTQEQAVAVAEVMSDVEAATMAGIEAGKEKARERWRKWKANQPANDGKRLPTTANVGQTLTGEGARVEDKTSNSEIESLKEERSAQAREFDQFWDEYPNKVGKPKAKASFTAARKRASFEAIMAGLRRYVASKPSDRAWLNPTTFLNQDRWGDQPAVVVPMARHGPAPPGKDSVANAARRRIEEEIQNAKYREIGAADGPQPLAGFLPLNLERARG